MNAHGKIAISTNSSTSAAAIQNTTLWRRSRQASPARLRGLFVLASKSVGWFGAFRSPAGPRVAECSSDEATVSKSLMYRAPYEYRILGSSTA